MLNKVVKSGSLRAKFWISWENDQYQLNQNEKSKLKTCQRYYYKCIKLESLTNYDNITPSPPPPEKQRFDYCSVDAVLSLKLNG